MSKDKKDKTKAVKIVVSGRVQRVFYRIWARNTAKSLHLNGWIKNMNDGKVEAYFEGSKKDIGEMIERCRIGSKFSDVKDIEVSWVAPENNSGFDIQY